MILNQAAQLMLMVGHADLLNNNDFPGVLEHLRKAVDEVQFRGRIIFTGPLPVTHDRAWMCTDMEKAWVGCERFTNKTPNFTFCNAGCALIDQHGVIPVLFSDSGLSLDGITELQKAMVF